MKEQQSAGAARIRTCIHALLHVFNQRSITHLRHLSLFKKGRKATGEFYFLNYL
jgi:hypothetical protein